MKTLLVTCAIINLFFLNLVNDTFSNLKFLLLVGFFCSNKEVKQIVLINWMGLEFFLFPKRESGANISPKKGEVNKIVEGGC